MSLDQGYDTVLAERGINLSMGQRQLVSFARAVAAQIAEGAPLAIQACLEVLQAIEMTPLEDAMKMTKKGQSGLPMYEKMMASQDAIEGPLAFAEKRKPNWKGR